jgi:ABC-type lipoprotein export system ATPase subunit
MSDLILEARDVRKTYVIEKTTLEVLKGVSVGVQRGETLAITGQSGAGKSTLLHVLGGLDLPSQGDVAFEGQSVYRWSGARRTRWRADRIGFVFQSFHLLPELDVADNVMLPALTRRGALREEQRHRARAVELLDRVGLAGRARHRPLELSGGEQQRAAIARALMNEPDLVLADEPTGNLDSKTGQVVLDYLFDLTRGRGHTVVLVTHNEALADLCSRRIHLKDGRIEQ